MHSSCQPTVELFTTAECLYKTQQKFFTILFKYLKIWNLNNQKIKKLNKYWATVQFKVWRSSEKIDYKDLWTLKFKSWNITACFSCNRGVVVDFSAGISKCLIYEQVLEMVNDFQVYSTCSYDKLAKNMFNSQSGPRCTWIVLTHWKGSMNA